VGYADGPTRSRLGKTPYGSTHLRLRDDREEAFGAARSWAAASSDFCTRPRQHRVCGALGCDTVGGSAGPHHEHGPSPNVTNFGTALSRARDAEGSVSCTMLVAGSTVAARRKSRDEAITRDGRYLYAIPPTLISFRLAGPSNGELDADRRFLMSSPPPSRARSERRRRDVVRRRTP